eukprot:TRINITY_DN30668_c0_g1_i15.p1 TRINITY_DN30668_c0_g1~~TRINITY_DN30668_c0_g1_i15.p1  ORF type:complete len:234 (-),score=26.78 TRINITY_DN30668_c0_g1_i15:127-789(-)
MKLVLLFLVITFVTSEDWRWNQYYENDPDYENDEVPVQACSNKTQELESKLTLLLSKIEMLEEKIESMANDSQAQQRDIAVLKDLAGKDDFDKVLNSYQPPRLDIQPLGTIVKRVGDTGFLTTCSAIGTPQPEIKWFKDDVEIDPEESDLFQISINVMDSKAAFNVISTLNFIGPGRLGTRKIMATDRGNYTCRFKNEVGQAESTLFFGIEDSPFLHNQH